MPTHTDSDSLRENLRKNIITLVQKMDFSVSTKLPSENWLAAKFDVSRSTIRAAVSYTHLDVYKRQQQYRLKPLYP